jgi:hypothetical protein
MSDSNWLQDFNSVSVNEMSPPERVRPSQQSDSEAEFSMDFNNPSEQQSPTP